MDICSLLKTARHSLYEILYFAVLVDRSLSHGHLFHISVFPISIIISTVSSLGAIMNEGDTLMCFSIQLLNLLIDLEWSCGSSQRNLSGLC